MVDIIRVDIITVNIVRVKYDSLDLNHHIDNMHIPHQYTIVV